MTSRSAEKRVLFVFSSKHVYGSELSLLPVVRSLGASWKPYFLVEGAGPLDTFLRKEGFPVDRLSVDLEALRHRRVGGAIRLLRLVYLLYSRRIQLVHVNLHFYAGLVSKACLVADIPIVVHVRNMIEYPVENQLCKYDGIICVSQAVRNSLATKSEVPPRDIAKRLWIIPDGRDLAPFQAGNRGRVRAEFGLDPATPLVGMVARITWMKGQDIFLHIAALVKERVPTMRFVLAGSTLDEHDKRYLQDLQKLAADLGLQKDVIFAGYRDDMPDVLAAMDCFVHPSRRGAFVSVLIEAMASGLPILASDVDGIPECVGRDGAAVLLPPDNPAVWADAVVGIFADQGLANRMAEKGRGRAFSLFDIAPLARQTNEVLETVYERYRTGDAFL